MTAIDGQEAVAAPVRVAGHVRLKCEDSCPEAPPFSLTIVEIFLFTVTKILPATLLQYRLRWYAIATARLLLRRWQMIVLVLGVLAPLADPADTVRTLGSLLLVVSDGRHGFLWRTSYFFGVQAFACLWVLLQREQIAGGKFSHFIASLPFETRTKRRVDLTVLMLASSPILVPVIGALMTIGTGRGTDQGLQLLQLLQLLLIVDILLLALVVQRATLNQRLQQWTLLIPMNIVMAAGLGAPRIGTQLAACCAVGFAALAMLGAELPRFGASWVRHAQRAFAPVHAAMLARVDRLPPLLLLSLSVLTRQRRPELLSKLMWGGGIVVAARVLMQAWDHDGRAFPLAVIAQSIVALLFSGLYRGLHMAHRDAASYFAALPLKPRWWRWFDTVCVGGLGMVFAAVPVILVYLHHGASLPQVLASIASATLLLCVLRVPQLAIERQAVVLCTIVAGVWTVVAAINLN